MTLTLRVLAPDQSVFDGTADEVILPSISGQVGILTGHVSLLTALDSGVLRVREGSNWSSIALMGGFAEVEANEVTVLVNAAELGSSIDPVAAEKALEAAQQAVAALEGKAASPDKVKAQQALAQAKARLAAAKAS
jgi:F-type H+-transporting ATPase subunit epsilon